MPGKSFSTALSSFKLGMITLSLTIAMSSNAFANSKYAAIVVDGSTGEVLHERFADAPRFPASLTKIMTLYILFERLKKGQLTFETRFVVNRHAANQPPSKLGLKPGSKIRVKDAIGALVTKSANDVAATVAVNISGSEKQFARLMTRKARSLGMTKTVFKNASGLPNRYQKTTARDMAKLSMRIMNDFPIYSRFFARKHYRFKRRSYRNHNGLLLSYKGTEGIKTGYTRASGFNLTTSIKRNNKHLIAVVMGGRTSRSRNAEMIRLLSKNLSKAVSTYNKVSLQQRMARINRPARSPIRSYGNGVVYTASISSAKRHSSKKNTKLIIKRFIPNGFGSLRQGRSYAIQVGVFEKRQLAIKQIKHTLNEVGQVLEDRPPYILPAMRGGVAVHRARFAGFYSRGRATQACQDIKKEMGVSCLVTMQ